MSDIERKKSHIVSSQLAECGLFVVLLTVSAHIKIPFPYVPLTFQTAVAVMAGLRLGARRGAACIAVYLFMGLLGLPVFSGGGGFAYVLQPTFGYLLGFAAAAFAAGIISGGRRAGFCRLPFAALCALSCNYAFGVLYFALIWHFYLHLSGLWQAVLVNNLLYLAKDIPLCVLSALLCVRSQVLRRGER